MSNIYRDVTLNQVSEQDIGKTIRVAGWVENIRDHGGVSFIDLRDMYAVMQIVIRDGKLLEGIRKEQAITVEGLIEKRDEETYNPKIPAYRYIPDRCGYLVHFRMQWSRHRRFLSWLLILHGLPVQ